MEPLHQRRAAPALRHLSTSSGRARRRSGPVATSLSPAMQLLQREEQLRAAQEVVQQSHVAGPMDPPAQVNQVLASSQGQLRLSMSHTQVRPPVSPTAAEGPPVVSISHGAPPTSPRGHSEGLKVIQVSPMPTSHTEVSPNKGAIRSPRRPVSDPVNHVQAPRSPGHTVSTPTIPGHAPHSPSYPVSSPTIPGHAPYSPSYPVSSPTIPGHAPHSPSYPVSTPTIPGHAPYSPSYPVSSPTISGQASHRPGWHVSTPTDLGLPPRSPRKPTSLPISIVAPLPHSPNSPVSPGSLHSSSGSSTLVNEESGSMTPHFPVPKGHQSQVRRTQSDRIPGTKPYPSRHKVNIDNYSTGQKYRHLLNTTPKKGVSPTRRYHVPPNTPQERQSSPPKRRSSQGSPSAAIYVSSSRRSLPPPTTEPYINILSGDNTSTYNPNYTPLRGRNETPQRSSQSDHLALTVSGPPAPFPPIEDPGPPPYSTLPRDHEESHRSIQSPASPSQLSVDINHNSADSPNLNATSPRRHKAQSSITYMITPSAHSVTSTPVRRTQSARTTTQSPYQQVTPSNPQRTLYQSSVWGIWNRACHLKPVSI